MQQFVQRPRINPHQSLFARNNLIRCQCDRDSDRRLRRALHPNPVQYMQLAVLQHKFYLHFFAQPTAHQYRVPLQSLKRFRCQIFK